MRTRDPRRHGILLGLAQPARPAARAWSDHTREQLVVPEYVLLEAVNALSRGNLRPRAHALVDLVQQDPQFEVVPASATLWTAGLVLHRHRPDKDWSLTDCISFHVMAERGIRSALAYDHHFEQAGFEPLLRRHP